jgi:hypothetical protein
LGRHWNRRVLVETTCARGTRQLVGGVHQKSHWTAAAAQGHSGQRLRRLPGVRPTLVHGLSGARNALVHEASVGNAAEVELLLQPVLSTVEMAYATAPARQGGKHVARAARVPGPRRSPPASPTETPARRSSKLPRSLPPPLCRLRVIRASLYVGGQGLPTPTPAVITLRGAKPALLIGLYVRAVQSWGGCALSSVLYNVLLSTINDKCKKSFHIFPIFRELRIGLRIALFFCHAPIFNAYSFYGNISKDSYTQYLLSVISTHQ